MAKHDPIPNSDHILRYIKPKYVEQDKDGNPVVEGGAFIARPNEKNCPSYNWLEIFGGDIGEQVQNVRDRARLKYAASALLARMNVGCVCKYVFEETTDDHCIAVIEDPLEKTADFIEDQSHSLMTNVPDENDPLRDAIGDLISHCVLDIYKARAE